MNESVKRLTELYEDYGDDDDGLVDVTAVNPTTKQRRKKAKIRGGSRPGKAANLKRDHAAGPERLWNDYFAPDPIYPPKLFKRRFRMSRQVFDRLHDAVVEHDGYFVQRPAGKLELSSHQKITAALRMYSKGEAADGTDEYIRIGESTAMKSFTRFTDAVISCFEKEYLRQPIDDNIKRHVAINEKRGFPGHVWIS